MYIFSFPIKVKLTRVPGKSVALFIFDIGANLSFSLLSIYQYIYTYMYIIYVYLSISIHHIRHISIYISSLALYFQFGQPGINRP